MSESQDPPSASGEIAGAHSIYTIEMVARITRLPEERIVYYYRSGLVSRVQAESESNLLFDEEAIHQLRRIAFLLAEYNFNHEGLKMVSSLLAEVERLRREVRFLRES